MTAHDASKRFARGPGRPIPNGAALPHERREPYEDEAPPRQAQPVYEEELTYAQSGGCAATIMGGLFYFAVGAIVLGFVVYAILTSGVLDGGLPTVGAAPTVQVVPVAAPPVRQVPAPQSVAQPAAPPVQQPVAVAAAPIVIPQPRPTAIVVPPTALPTVQPPIPLDKGEYMFVDHGPSVAARYCVQMPELGVEVCDPDISMTFDATQQFIARSIKLGTMHGTPITAGED
jgi:hypothetical protein